MLRVSKDALLILALVAVVAQFVAFTNVSHAIAGPTNYGLDFSKYILNVFVANDNAHPVPVAVQGPVDTSAVDASASQAFQTTLGFIGRTTTRFRHSRSIIHGAHRQTTRYSQCLRPSATPSWATTALRGIYTTVDNNQGSHYFPTSFAGTLGTEKDFYQFGQETWIVADGGTTVYQFALRSSGTNPDSLTRIISIEVTGYLIDVSP